MDTCHSATAALGLAVRREEEGGEATARKPLVLSLPQPYALDARTRPHRLVDGTGTSVGDQQQLLPLANEAVSVVARLKELVALLQRGGRVFLLLLCRLWTLGACDGAERVERIASLLQAKIVGAANPSQRRRQNRSQWTVRSPRFFLFVVSSARSVMRLREDMWYRLSSFSKNLCSSWINSSSHS